MSEQTDVDLKMFQTKVLQELENLQGSVLVGAVQNGGFAPLTEYGTGDTRRLTQIPMQAAASPESHELDVSEHEGKIIAIEGQDTGSWIFSANVIDESSAEIVTRKDIRERLCPALQSVSNDVFEIAKVSTPVLGSLSLAGVISIPLNPAMFAVIALLIARMGIASLCAEHKK